MTADRYDRGAMPETMYARRGDDHIAYQVIESGPIDLVFMNAWFSHIDGRWDEPRFAKFLRQLSSFSRLILFDKRGTGASDALPAGDPSWEDWADDVRTVMDAVGSERAAVVGVGDTGPMAILFAATYPQRVCSLVLANTFPRLTRTADYPWGLAADDVQTFLTRTKETWGTGGLVDVFSPSMANDERYRQWWARYQRMAASPGASTGMARLTFGIDVRQVLSAITVPTLVIHRSGFRFIPIEHGRYLAEHIPGAKLVEVPGDDGFLYLGNADAIADAIEEFVTGSRRVPEPDRVLATVLLTDMVKSTDRAAELGDHKWRALLDASDDVVLRSLDDHRGRLVRNTGDGILATFDGPVRGIRCAATIRDGLHDVGVECRAGLHTGEIELRGSEIGGINVHIAARIMAEAGPGEILVSSTVKDLVTGADVRFEDRGLRLLRGVPREWQLFSVG